MQLRLFLSSIFFQHIAYGLLIPTLIIWQNQNGLDYLQIGLIQTVGLLIIMLAEVPSSYLADKIGRKRIIISAFLVTIISLIILASAANFISFLSMQILLSFGLALFSGTQESQMHDLNGREELTKALGKMALTDELGTILGMLISTLAITMFSIQISFYVAIISMVIGLSCCLFVNVKEENFISEKKNENSSLKNWLTMSGLLGLLAFGLISFRGESLFQSQLSFSGISMAALGIVYVIGKLFSILGSALAHKIEKKYGWRNSMIMMAILQAVSFCFLIANNYIASVVALSLFFFAENVFRNIRDSWVLLNTPRKFKTSYLSIVSLSTAIVAMFLNPFIGMAIDHRIFYAIIIVVFLKTVGGLILIFMQKSSFAHKIDSKY